MPNEQMIQAGVVGMHFENSESLLRANTQRSPQITKAMELNDLLWSDV